MHLTSSRLASTLPRQQIHANLQVLNGSEMSPLFQRMTLHKWKSRETKPPHRPANSRHRSAFRLAIDLVINVFSCRALQPTDSPPFADSVNPFACQKQRLCLLNVVLTRRQLEVDISMSFSLITTSCIQYINNKYPRCEFEESNDDML